jgi:cleavage and polyadenylation specificity factor subunit 1
MHREHLFVGSTVGPSTLLRSATVKEPVINSDEMDTSEPTVVVDAGNAMDVDDDDGMFDPTPHLPMCVTGNRL